MERMPTSIDRDNRLLAEEEDAQLAEVTAS